MKSRAYTGLADLDAMKQLLISILQEKPDSALHPGDLDWRLFSVSHGYAHEDIMRLWEDDQGQVVAWLFIYPKVRKVDLVIHPNLSGTSAEESILIEAEAYLTKFEPMSMFVFADDAPRRALLENHGYVGEECRIHLSRPIDETLPNTPLPPGFVILPMQVGNYVERRAALHAEAFNLDPVMMTERYAAVRNSPGYDKALDVVVVAPDGQYAAFALAWADTVNKIGMFEPMGTHPNYQRQGLGSVALIEALRRLQRRGIETVTVRTHTNMEEAIAFYKSLEFEHLNTILCYKRA